MRSRISASEFLDHVERAEDSGMDSDGSQNGILPSSIPPTVEAARSDMVTIKYSCAASKACSDKTSCMDNNSLPSNDNRLALDSMQLSGGRMISGRLLAAMLKTH